MIKEEKEELDKWRFLCNETVRQYELEMNAYDTLTSRANGLLLAVNTILILLTIALIQITTTQGFSIYIELFMVSYILFSISLFCSMESYKVSMLTTLNPRKFIERHSSKYEIDILKQLISNVVGDLEDTQNISTKRMKYINISLNFFKLGIISLLILTIIFIYF